MDARLFAYLQRPNLWQRSELPFWDDEHISKGMLEAHLNPDWDAASRKDETIERSVAWLATVIPPRARLLDLGCGPGLYARRLSARGYRVTGVDFSRRSIAYAKAHDAATEYIYDDYLNLNAREAYDAIALIYCDYAALTPPERARVLQNARRALAPGGIMILDAFTPAHFEKKKESAQWSSHPGGGFWSQAPHVCLDAEYLYQNGAVCADRHVVITDGGIADYIIWDTAFTPRSLAEEMQAAGFRVNAFYADVCGAPYEDGCETLCCLAQKPGADA